MTVQSIVRHVGALPLLLIAFDAGAQPVVYRLVELGPADVTQTFSFGINGSGTVAGVVTVPGPISHEPRAVRTVNDAFTIPPGLDRGSLALGINANGDITGSIYVSPWPAVEYHVMRYTDAGGVEDLGSGIFGNRGEGLCINRSRQIAGWVAWGSGSRAFVSQPSGLRDLGTLGGPSAVAYGINDAGTVVGTSTIPDGTQQAFVTPPGGFMRSLGIPLSGARSVNNRDQIAGSFVNENLSSHPFRYTPGVGLENLDPDPFRSGDAYGINDRGDVVGVIRASGSVFPHAFVYTDAEGLVDLNERIVTGGQGWTVIRSTGINNKGEIVAQAFKAGSFFERAVKLIPADLIPPVIQSASVDPSALWPPDRRLVPVTVSAVATDDSDPAPRCAVESVDIVDEAFDASDAQITGDLSAVLRADRSGHAGVGRTYLLNIACTDASGNRAATTVSVAVPHDSGGADGRD